MPVANDQGNGRTMRIASDGAKLAGYPTPTARDWKGPQGRAKKNKTFDLPAVAMMFDLAPWGIPTTMDSLPGGANLEERRKRGGCSNVKEKVFGTMSNGSPAVTGNGAPLHPDLCRWLMGYPKEWDVFGGSATA
jgi:hypothetical protein